MVKDPYRTDELSPAPFEEAQWPSWSILGQGSSEVANHIDRERQPERGYVMGEMYLVTSKMLSSALIFVLMIIVPSDIASASCSNERTTCTAPARGRSATVPDTLATARSYKSLVASAELLLLAVEESPGGKSAATENDPVEDDDEVDLIGPTAPSPEAGSPRIELVRVAGELSPGGDHFDAFMLVLSESKALRIETVGATDTVGALLDHHGRPLAVDDDGGEDMNFRLVSDLSPGRYLVRVAGYRGAGGSYSLIVESLDHY